MFIRLATGHTGFDGLYDFDFVPGKALAARVAHVILSPLVNFGNVASHLVAGGEKFAAELRKNEGKLNDLNISL